MGEVSKLMMGIEGIGQDGGILNFMPDISETVKRSNGAVVEIGVGKGKGSTLAIHLGLLQHPNPLHISVDIEDAMEWKPDAPWWTLLVLNSTVPETVEEVRARLGGREPGLIFIDTHHTYDHMECELRLWSQIAGKETVWLMHDTYLSGPRNQMTDAIVDFTKQHTEWVYEDWRTEPHGLGRMRWRR